MEISLRTSLNLATIAKRFSAMTRFGRRVCTAASKATSIDRSAAARPSESDATEAAQIIRSCRNIRRAEKGRQPGVWLLDHFVGTQQDGSRDGQGERLGSIEVEHKFERAGLLHRQVGRFGTIENAPDVASHFAIRVAKARPVAQQTAVNDIFAPRKDRRYPMLGREQNELSTLAGEERIFGA
jgi:hypothetical protein